MLPNPSARALIVVAHPDDETLGAASFLLRRRCCRLIHVTDGAPRARRFRAHGPDGAPPRSRGDYARQRRAELEQVLALVGFDRDQASCLEVPDMEAAQNLGFIADQIAAAILDAAPDFVVAHDYAGGHPDHDAVAWAARAASDRLADAGHRPPPIYEMPLYHGAGGSMRLGEFLPYADAIEAVELSEDERRRKRAMLDAFISQHEMLRPFTDLQVEQFRRAPRYDFSKPPHPGPLLYERWGFPLSGERWRSLAQAASSRS